MEVFSSKLQYKLNSVLYYKNIFPWLTDKQIKKYFKPTKITNNVSNGLLFVHNNNYYFHHYLYVHVT